MFIFTKNAVFFNETPTVQLFFSIHLQASNEKI